jgi:hypothetical protein
MMTLDLLKKENHLEILMHLAQGRRETDSQSNEITLSSVLSFLLAKLLPVFANVNDRPPWMSRYL